MAPEKVWMLGGRWIAKSEMANNNGRIFVGFEVIATL